MFNGAEVPYGAGMKTLLFGGSCIKSSFPLEVGKIMEPLEKPIKVIQGEAHQGSIQHASEGASISCDHLCGVLITPVMLISLSLWGFKRIQWILCW